MKNFYPYPFYSSQSLHILSNIKNINSIYLWQSIFRQPDNWQSNSNYKKYLKH